MPDTNPIPIEYYASDYKFVPISTPVLTMFGSALEKSTADPRVVSSLDFDQRSSSMDEVELAFWFPSSRPGVLTFTFSAVPAVDCLESESVKHETSPSSWSKKMQVEDVLATEVAKLTIVIPKKNNSHEKETIDQLMSQWGPLGESVREKVGTTTRFSNCFKIKNDEYHDRYKEYELYLPEDQFPDESLAQGMPVYMSLLRTILNQKRKGKARKSETLPRRWLDRPNHCQGESKCIDDVKSCFWEPLTDPERIKVSEDQVLRPTFINDQHVVTEIGLIRPVTKGAEEQDEWMATRFTLSMKTTYKPIFGLSLQRLKEMAGQSED